MQQKHLFMSTVISRQTDRYKSKRWIACLPGCHLILSALGKQTCRCNTVSDKACGCSNWETRTCTHARTRTDQKELSVHKHTTCVCQCLPVVPDRATLSHSGVIRASSHNLPPMSFLHTSLRWYSELYYPPSTLSIPHCHCLPLAS